MPEGIRPPEAFHGGVWRHTGYSAPEPTSHGRGTPMQANTLSQKAKGIIATIAGVLLVVLPIVLDGSAVKWVAGIIGVCAALGVVVVPNAPTQQQYQDVARDVLGTSLVNATVDQSGRLNAVTVDGTPTTVTITPNPEQRPITNTSPRGAADLSVPVPGDAPTVDPSELDARPGHPGRPSGGNAGGLL